MLSDYEQIQQLLARYCFAVDGETAEVIAALFWPDATVNFDGRVNDGQAAFTRGFARWIEKMRDPVENLRHVLGLPDIDIGGELAAVQVYYDADGHARRSGRIIHLRGVYRGVLQKRAEEWRIAEWHVLIWKPLATT